MQTSRTEQEMFELILAAARADENIRAVVLNGSRANPQAPKDPFQDFDIVYLVRDVWAYRQKADAVSAFGSLMILQTPDDMPKPAPQDAQRYAYLMQFMDGNRIDLTIAHLSLSAEFIADSQSISLLDKDSLLPALPEPSDRDYLPTPPTEKQFADCCNEFWWVSVYIAKGLWRNELTYAHSMLDEVVRPQLLQMLTWQAGFNTGFQKSPGKCGKYLEVQLNPQHWQMLEQTYPSADPESAWQALFTMGSLFRQVAQNLADHYHFAYPAADDQQVSAHLHHIHTLPASAASQYSE